MNAQKSLMWCTQYDQESYNKQFQRISFIRYLNMIVSNKYFPNFQIQAAKQIADRDQWNDKCWHLLQLFESLNNLFDTNQTDKNITFIDDLKLRKILGGFRLWIDLQRLYLITFLKLDKITFQDLRIFMTLYRTAKYFSIFFSNYQYLDFLNDYPHKIQKGTIPHLQMLKQLVNEDTKMVVDQIIDTIRCFVSQTPVINHKQKPYDKIAYKKLSQTFSMEIQVNARLNHNIKYQQNKYRQIMIDEIKKVPLPIQDAESYYDPQSKLITEFVKRRQSQGQKVSQKQKQKLIQEYKEKVKGKYKQSQNVYSQLMKIGHNPFDQNNFVLYGDLLGIDMNKRKQYQKADYHHKNVTQENQQRQKTVCYDPQFLSNMKSINNKSANIQYNDLAFKNLKDANKPHSKNIMNQFQPKVKQLQWTYDADQTRRATNQPKDLTNNFLFRKDEQQQDQHEKKQIVNLFVGNRFTSLALNQMELTKLKMQQQGYFPNLSKTIFNYKTLQFKNFSQFDFLRKLIQYEAVSRKLQKIINQKNIPQYYPRFIDQIKIKMHNDQIYYLKVNLAKSKNY